MKFFDAFSGYGGFHLGIERAYDNHLGRITGTSDTKNRRNMSLSAECNGARGRTHTYCIGYSEIDKYAEAVYKHNFGGKNYGDITKIKADELPDFELFCGGFPCQAFSVAGKRGGFKDARGTLFFDIARIAKQKQPRYLLLENVKGLLSHDKGRTFQTILRTLDELGYSVEWQVLNAKDFGVPQNRERVFIIGHLGGFGGRQVFPIRCGDRQDNEQSRGESKIVNTIKTKQGTMQNDSTYIVQLNQPTHSNNRVYSEKGISPTLNTAQGGNRQPFIKAVLTPDRINKRQNGRRMKECGEPSFTLNTQDKHGIYDGMKIRRLTPKECERLMGLPDGWTKYGNFDGETKEISDTQRYKLCGNGVVINVVEIIITNLLN